MKRTIAALVMGLVMGALLMALVPASADHGADFRRLKKRVATLEDKAQLLGHTGRYRGFINTAQVVASAAGQCANGSDAVWVPYPTDPKFSLLWCSPGGTPQGSAR